MTAFGLMNLALPVLGLIVAAVLIPRLIARLVPEGVPWLIGNAVISALILLAISAGYFAVAYLGQGARFVAAFGAVPAASALHFVKLGAMAALIWAPVLVLSLSGLPRHWKEVEW